MILILAQVDGAGAHGKCPFVIDMDYGTVWELVSMISLQMPQWRLEGRKAL